MPIAKKLTIVISGDRGTGKSRLASSYQIGDYSSVPPPSDVEERYRKKVMYNGDEYELEVVDTIDNEIYSDLDRDLLFQECDCVLFTYSITEVQSFNNLVSRYGKLPITIADHEKLTIVNDQVRKFPPIILVGTKLDMEMQRQVAIDDANQICDELALDGVIECSPSTGFKVSEVFEKGIELGVKHLLDQYTEDEVSTSAPLKESRNGGDSPATKKSSRAIASSKVKEKKSESGGCCVVM